MARNDIEQLLAADTRRPTLEDSGTAAIYQASVPGLATSDSQSSAAGQNAVSQSLGTLVQTLPDVGQQLTQLVAAQTAQLDSLTANTQAVQQNTSSKSTDGGVGGTIERSVSSIFGGGLLGPLIGGLASLFGGGDDSTPAPLTKYSLPSAVSFDGGVGAGNGILPVVNGAGGSAKAVSAPNVTVNVSAMDSRSFLDHSDEIASAVRQALLQANSLTDTIAELERIGRLRGQSGCNPGTGSQQDWPPHGECALREKISAVL